MSMIFTTDATSMTARFRMSVHCPEFSGLESVAGTFIEARRVAGADVLGYGVAPVSFKDTTLGVRAWSPPV